MRRPLAALIALAASVWLQGAPPAVTIYNQDFAVVRELVLLNLKAGLNHVEYAGMTANAEPDSVILRDPTGKATLQILEQNYRNDVASLGRMLDHFQGTTIQFERPNGTTVTGRIIRGQTTMQSNNYGQQFPIENLQPMIELDGQIRFDLPGIPLFPKNADRDGVNTLLKPVMSWTIRSDCQSAVDAELGYVTGGLNWKADYNIISSETNDRVDLIGWVTIANRSGKSFPEAQIALMAGDVNKEMLGQNGAYRIGGVGGMIAGAGPIAPPAVTEKPFDDYHLYKLSNRTTLLDNETKQVEFVRANGVATKTVYIYDGADFSRYANVYNVFEQIRNISDYGTQMTPKVAVMREFVNSIANSLGMPLPKGRLRFYRRDSAHIEFTGENNIDHTPKDETIRVLTGAAFDLIGSRKRTTYHNDFNRQEADESFEISVHNRKAVPALVSVREHLYRSANWTISNATDTHVSPDGNTVEFPVTVSANSDKILRYSVHYTW